MRQTSLIIHVVMIAIAGAIGYLYIYPTVQAIKKNQDMAVTFNNELAKVSSVNAQLQQKVMAVNSIPIPDKEKLIIFMPDTLDEISILRTMEAILLSVNIEPASLALADNKESDNNLSASTDSTEILGNTDQEQKTEAKTIKKIVTVTFETNEQTLMDFFAIVEQSSLPFVTKKVALSPTEIGLIKAELDYEVYALNDQVADLRTTEDIFNNDGIGLGEPNI